MITLTLDMYFSGLSSRKIARLVNDHFGLDLDQSTIYKWIKKFVPIVSDYVNSLSPKLSHQWHADELFVKMRGAQKVRDGNVTGFVWNVMDRKTRFLIASKLTENREADSAVKVFKFYCHDTAPSF